MQNSTRDLLEFGTLEDAQDILHLARSRRNTCQAEVTLLQQKLQESLNLVIIYRRQLEASQIHLNQADFWVGTVRARMRARGMPVTTGGHYSSGDSGVRTITPFCWQPVYI